MQNKGIVLFCLVLITSKRINLSNQIPFIKTIYLLV